MLLFMLYLLFDLIDDYYSSKIGSFFLDVWRDKPNIQSLWSNCHSFFCSYTCLSLFVHILSCINNELYSVLSTFMLNVLFFSLSKYHFVIIVSSPTGIMNSYSYGPTWKKLVFVSRQFRLVDEETIFQQYS